MEVSVFHRQESNLTINSPLMEVIVDKADIHQTLIAKIQEDKKISLNNQIGWAVGSLFSSGLCIAGAFLLTTASRELSLGLMGIGFGGGLISSIKFVAIGIPLSTRIERNSEIARVSNLFSDFLRAFSAFKNEPNDDHIKIIFDKFDILSAENLLKNEQLFSGIGKLVLMDKVATTLKNKKIESNIADEWQASLKCKPDNFKIAELSAKLEIKNPLENSYILFKEQRQNFESIKILKRMKEIFNKMIEETCVVEK